MTLDDNKRIALRFQEILHENGQAALEEVVHENFVEHNIRPGVKRGIAGMRELRDTVRTAMPDIRVKVEQLVAEGDYVFALLKITGTHTGPFNQFQATGKRVSIQAMELLRLKDGKVYERWHLRDNVTLVMQLGRLTVTPPT